MSPMVLHEVSAAPRLREMLPAVLPAMLLRLRLRLWMPLRLLQTKGMLRAPTLLSPPPRVLLPLLILCPRR